MKTLKDIERLEIKFGLMNCNVCGETSKEKI